MRKYFFAILLMPIFFQAVQAQDVTCRLMGKIVDRTSIALLLLKSPGDIRAGSIRIPIIHQQFEYLLTVKDVEAYQLVFEDEYQKGVWRPIVFFPDLINIQFTLYPQVLADKNIVEGGLLNKAYIGYNSQLSASFDSRFTQVNKKRDELRKQGDFYSGRYDSVVQLLQKNPDQSSKTKLYAELDRLNKTGEAFTASGKQIQNEQQTLMDERTEWKYRYIQANPSLVSYFLLLQDAYSKAKENDNIFIKVVETFPFFVALFPKHSYTSRLQNEVAGLRLRKPGESFVDFSAPDLNGKIYTFSKLLNNKITLLDLWGSWCGPCIAATRTMRPLYNEFKSKGFQIIGVAREFKTTAALKNALKREKYPWLNLIDLDDKNQIWSKYNISNAGGAIFLFDKDGKILAVSPTSEEVRKILISKL